MMRIGRPSIVQLLTIGFVTFGGFWGGFLGWNQISGAASALDRFENLTVDWRFVLAGAHPAPRGVVIAAIDDEAVRVAGTYPLPREKLAQIVQNIAALDPETIALDIALLDTGKADANHALAQALGKTHSVIAAIGQFEGGAPSGSIPAPSEVLWPAAEFRAAARTGLVNIATDAEGVPRHIPLLYRIGDDFLPSFALAAASAALNTEPVFASDALRLAGHTTPTDIGYHLPIRYYGPRGSIRQFSVARALEGGVKPDDVRGQIVLIGATAVGVGDTFATPFDRLVPGVEVFATGISNLLTGDGLIRTAQVRRFDAGATILLPCATVLLMAMRRVRTGLSLAGLVVIGWAALTFLAFVEGYWLNIAAPLAALAPTAIGYGAARDVLDRLAATRLAEDNAALAPFHSPVILQHILKNRAFLQTPVEQSVAVVFLDLSGFTGLAESLGHQWTRDLLARLHALIVDEVTKQSGLVISFMGDGAMIVFGLPEPKPSDATRALLTVVGLHASMRIWLDTLPPVASERLNVRIGAHFGVAVLSRLGPSHQQHITATGDTVNVASRLLEVAKQVHHSVVVSEDLILAANTVPALTALETVTRLDVNIRGRAKPLSIRAWA